MKRTILIAGSGRSGTTWIQDSLAEANKMKTLFEPLHPRGVKCAAQFAYKYFDREDRNETLTRFMSKVLSGEMKSIWANYRIRPDRFNLLRHGVTQPFFYLKKFYRHYRKYNSGDQNGLIVKLIRANLMLPWITANFNIRTVFIIRHPCAVISSRMKLPDADWGAEQAIGRYRNNPDVVALIDKVFGVDFNKEMSSAAALACVWCIENLLPMKWAKESNYEIFAYEYLLTDLNKEWERLVQYLQLEHVPDEVLLRFPSQQVSPDMRDRNITSQHVERWKQHLNMQQLADIATILDEFLCTCYSVDSGMPILSDSQLEESA